MDLRRCWTEIDLGQIVNNFLYFSRTIDSSQEMMAVIKADAYGHGDGGVAKVLQTAGCRHFAVSNLQEALNLRDAGVTGQVLILGYTPVSCAGVLAENGITQAIISAVYAEELAKKCRESGLMVKCHLAVDTGMNRIGVEPEECDDVLKKFRDVLDINGVFTHLNHADSPEGEEYTRGQIDIFRNIAPDVRYRHILNSAGIMWFNEPVGNLVRLGITMYGLKPDYGNSIPDEILPALSWKSVVAMIKNVHAGESIGYGRSFTAARDMRVATVPVGYADGYPRLLSNRGSVIIRGKMAPVVGRVCMDQIMVDVTDIPDVSCEDEVILIGASEDGNVRITADDIGNLIGTIGYEIVCGISKRVSRHFL